MAMQIRKFRIKNYKSFWDSGEVELTDGFNILVGQNNAGKTAALEALSLQFVSQRHKSLKTLPTPKAKHMLSNVSSIDFEFYFSPDEVLDILAYHKPFYLNVVSNMSNTDVAHEFRRTVSNGLIVSGTVSSSGIVAKLSNFHNIISSRQFLQCKIDPISGEVNVGGEIFSENSVRGRLAEEILVGTLRSQVYRFNAERMNLGISPYNQGGMLEPNAANLPTVLNQLQTAKPHDFDDIIEKTKVIFPDIALITAPKYDDANIQIKLWIKGTPSKRDDLAIALKESGSGIGQVLAILTVVVTSEQPRIIIIDEPQSFLHPGAITKLFRILKQDYPQHQYIVSTHSPTVITAAEPKTLLLVKKEGSESRIEQIDVKNSQSQRRFLTEIGASLADVFGADNVLWVEGATEEECYPKLLSGILSKNLMATAIVGVINTGDLEGRHHEIIKKIYDKLSDSTGLIPPAVGFIFDREKRSESEISDLKDRGIHLIPRRMYENYLLHPAAIAAHIVELDGYEGKDSLEASIQAWLDLHKWDANYFHGKVSKQSDDYWLVNVHGAQILHDIYKAHTHVDRPHSFLDNKVEYSVWLTEYLIKHEPDALRELAEFIDDVIERGREKLVAKEG